ncbi:MAG: TonB-dependent receptor [Rhodobacteraceae bacterium]|nr:TonB-dependent receptor [Paracoccaceae bacterium]
MKHPKTAYQALKGLLLASAASFASFAAVAQEGQQAAALEEIVVTGSRIQRTDLVSNSPVSVVSFEEIKNVGTSNIEEFLRDLPQATADVGRNGNNGNDGTATVNLRNLEPERTLVLVNGKRFVPYDAGGLVDLNMIPTSLIERVEVVTGGASAVYGSDAIAGVVNFILKENFEGVEFNTQYGMSEKGDGDVFDISSTVGGNFANGRGNVVFNVGYTKQDPVTQGDRAFSNFALAAADFSPGGSITAPEGVFFTSADDPQQFDSNGNLVPLFQTFNFNPFNLLQVPHKKWTATGLARYEITDDVEYFARMSYGGSRVSTIIAPSGTFFFPFNINYATNPFLNAQARAVLAAEDTAAAGDPTPGDGFVTLSFGRRTVEVGTRDSVYENSSFQFVNGFRGDLGDSYQWEVFGQYGRTLRTQNFLNDLNFTRTQQAVLAVTGSDGNPACSDPSGGCVPANLFGAGNLSDAAAQFIRVNLVENDSSAQWVAGGQITGDLPFTSPGADSPGGFAFGVEYREELASHRPDDIYATGSAIGFGSSSPIKASYTVKEAFVESLVPLVEDAPGADLISLDLGLRVSEYKSTVGTTKNKFNNETYKAGGGWSPVDGFRIRGLYQRAVRAPNLDEIGNPRTPSTGDASVDYCAGTNPVGNAQLTALCIATGVPAVRIGSVQGPIAGQINNYLGGNPGLRPEKSNTYTLGAIFTPEQMPGFELVLDYYRVSVSDAIVNPTEQAILDACYTVELSATAPFCSLISRNPLNGSLIGGTETGVDASKVNAANFRAEGIDFRVAYTVDVGEWGSVDLDLNGTRVFKSIKQDASFLPANNCVGLVGDICSKPDPKWRWLQTTSWNFDNLMLQLRWQYIGKVSRDTVALQGDSPANYAVPTISARHYFDLTGSYQVTDNVSIRGGITNLFDKKPPVVGNDYGGTLENSGNTYPAVYDPIGRSFFLGASASF